MVSKGPFLQVLLTSYLVVDQCVAMVPQRDHPYHEGRGRHLYDHDLHPCE
ncbi:MAG: hypothetical protein AB2693_26400 [Candidatus Thiodiazotropha sp.]